MIARFALTSVLVATMVSGCARKPATDPIAGRLAPRQEVLARSPASSTTGLVEVRHGDPEPGSIPDGTRVRVVNDGRRDRKGDWLGADRMVDIVVNEGPRKGLSGQIPRNELALP